MAKFLEITKTENQRVTDQAMYLISKAIRECNNSIFQLKKLAIENGGKNNFLEMLGDKSDGVVEAYTDLKTLVEKISDITTENL